MNGIEEEVRWLKNLHVWGIAIGLPVLAWLIAKANPRRR